MESLLHALKAADAAAWPLHAFPCIVVKGPRWLSPRRASLLPLDYNTMPFRAALMPLHAALPH